MEEERVVLTPELIHSLATGSGVGWTKRQLEILGVKWPPKKGWLMNLSLTTISAQQFAELKRIRDERTR